MSSLSHPHHLYCLDDHVRYEHKGREEDFNKRYEDDQDKYAKNYDEKGLFNLLKRLGKEIVKPAYTLYLIMTHKDTPPWAKVLVVGALGYLISPIDFIPDVIPVIGYMDDIAIMGGTLLKLKSFITDEITASVATFMNK